LKPRYRLIFSSCPTDVSAGWYTFQLMFFSDRASGAVNQSQLPTAAGACAAVGVKTIGPPFLPSGSSMPDR